MSNSSFALSFARTCASSCGHHGGCMASGSLVGSHEFRRMALSLYCHLTAGAYTLSIHYTIIRCQNAPPRACEHCKHARHESAPHSFRQHKHNYFRWKKTWPHQHPSGPKKPADFLVIKTQARMNPARQKTQRTYAARAA